MKENNEIVAKILLDIEAVHYFKEKPFVFTSGTKSPVYVDCRKLISFPKERNKVIDIAKIALESSINMDKINVLAGGETAGIPYASWIADRLDLPMIYVRKKPKSFGRLAQIEGVLDQGANVLLIEDLLFDAQSKINFCNAIRNAGANISDTLVIFNYGIPKSEINLDSNNINLISLCDWKTIIKVASRIGYFDKRQIEIILIFLENPSDWF